MRYCIGASDMTLQFYLLPYLEAVPPAEYPGVKVHGHPTAPTPETIQSLVCRGGSISVWSATPFEARPEDCSVTPVSKIRNVFVAGKASSPSLKGKRLRVRALG